MDSSMKESGRKYTYEDYVTWDDGKRWELIEGIPYLMTPAPSRRHQDISRNVLVLFANYLKGKSCKVYDAPFDVILSNENTVQPDLVVVCDSKKLTDRGCEGAPDLVIEILSPSTAKKDISEKFALYEKFGVKQYWIIYPFGGIEDQVHIYKLNEQRKYGEAEVYSKEQTVKVGLFEDLSIDVKEVFE